MFCYLGEEIVKFNDVGREMYFINTGVVVVYSGDGKTVYNVLSDGSNQFPNFLDQRSSF